MKAASLGALCAALLLAPAYGASAGRITVTHYEPLQRLDLRPAAPAEPGQVATRQPASLAFDALGRTFELLLEPNDRLMGATARRKLRGEARAFRGTLAGRPGSWVRIVLADGHPRGFIVDGDEVFALEAPGDSALASASPIIYRLADAVVEPGAMSCGVEAMSAAQAFGQLVGELEQAKASGPGATMQIDLGAIGDFEFFDGRLNPEGAILDRLNIVDGIYSEQLGVQVNVPALEIFEDAEDPFTDETDAGSLLDELADYRLATPAQRDQGLTHLFTGKDLDDNTVGMAFTGVLCRPRVGAALTQVSLSAAFDSLVAAHEIGHNFGAPHDGESGSPCESETGRFLMAPTVNGSDEFSQCSIEQIQPHIAQALDTLCIVPLHSFDMAVALDGELEPMLLGDSATFTFSLDNAGSETATGIRATIFVSEILPVGSVAISQGTCAEEFGLIECDVGMLSGGESAVLTLDVTAAATGEATVTADVDADEDENPENDGFDDTLEVLSGVDMAVNPIASRDVDLNQVTTATINVANNAVIAATAVTVSILLDNALQAQSATWSLGDCDVTAQEVTCEVASVPAESSTPLQLGIRGVSSGTSSYEVTLASTEDDTNPVNNSGTGVVTVGASAMTNGGGGGGASGLASLLVLALSLLLRRRIDSRHPRRSNTPLASGIA